MHQGATRLYLVYAVWNGPLETQAGESRAAPATIPLHFPTRARTPATAGAFG